MLVTSVKVDVDAFLGSCCGSRLVFEAFEMESRSLWNLRFVVTSAVGIPGDSGILGRKTKSDWGKTGRELVIPEWLGQRT